jgi:hypothetical protein
MKSFQEYCENRGNEYKSDLKEHDSQTMMDKYGQMAYRILSKKIGFKAGSYMQNMFSDSDFIKELTGVWQSQFGVTRSSDLEPVIDNYFKSNPR